MFHSIALARNAMHTRFEIVLHGENPVSLRAAGEEALDEIERLEAQLSLFQPSSEIAHLNARAARESVRVTPSLFALLKHARQLTDETGGAFDITVAPLMRCWGLLGGTDGHVPTTDELAAARAAVGMNLVELGDRDYTVRFARAGVMLDLGAIGKGHAIDRAAEILREAGITRGILHGGTSTAYAIGQPMDASRWSVAVDSPTRTAGAISPVLATVPLQDESMSVSAASGKCFEIDGSVYGHVIDPRTGRPAENAVLAAVVAPSATETDALSTALLTVGPAGHELIAGLRPGLKTLVASRSRAGQELMIETKGLVLNPSR